MYDPFKVFLYIVAADWEAAVLSFLPGHMSAPGFTTKHILMLQNLCILSVLPNTKHFEHKAASPTTTLDDGVCQMPTDSPASLLCPWTQFFHQAVFPQGWVLLSSRLCVRMEAKPCLLIEEQNCFTSLAYPKWIGIETSTCNERWET